MTAGRHVQVLEAHNALHRLRGVDRLDLDRRLREAEQAQRDESSSDEAGELQIKQDTRWRPEHLEITGRNDLDQYKK